jgi:hypothetical protein
MTRYDSQYGRDDVDPDAREPRLMRGRVGVWSCNVGSGGALEVPALPVMLNPSMPNPIPLLALPEVESPFAPNANRRCEPKPGGRCCSEDPLCR